MPELPEVETVVRTLRPLLLQRTFTGSELLWPRTLQSIDAELFAARLIGQTIVGVQRRAKFIVIEFGSGDRITVHLRMTGELLFQESPTAPLPQRQLPYLRASFGLNDGAALHFFDVRKFGRIQLLSPSEWALFDASLGVEPLSSDFTPSAFRAMLTRRRRQVKPLLLDQTVIAGLGNIYVDESLFRARIHPLQPSDLVSARKAADLQRVIVTVLHEAVEDRGTTLRDYRGGSGQEGEHQHKLLVYGSPAGHPCPRCGAGLARAVIGQRGTVFCPRCQRLTVRRDTPRQ